MAWANAGTAQTWNVTDQELLSRIQYALLENGAVDSINATNLFSTMFTRQQFIDALDLAQRQFLRDTSCILTRATQAATPGVSRYALPQNWIHTRRMAYQLQTAGSPSKALVRTDAFELDHQAMDWQQNLATPTVYNESDLPTLTVEIVKAPSDAGTMQLDYTAQPVTLDGTGIKLTVPDECETAVLMNALFQLFSQDGEAHDPQRAQYCWERYELSVQLTQLLMGGPPDA
jgi:hypothetical protein